MAASPPSVLLGSEHPRIGTEPLRELTPETSRGFEVCEFAESVLGEPLLPWQRQAAIRGLELLPDGRFRFSTVLVLTARQNGKTTLLRAIALWKLFLDNARTVLGTAQSLGLAREVWSECLNTIRGIDQLRPELEKFRAVNGDEQFWISGGGRYKVAAATRSGARGLSVDLLIADEIREQRNWAGWSAISKTTIARPRAQTWCLSNAGDDQSIVLNHLRDSALSGRDSSIAIFEWSAPESCELDDRQAWAAANPGLGHTILETAIASALAIDPPAVFRTEVLCQRVDTLDAAIDPGAWSALVDATGSMDHVRDQVVACVDVAPDGGHVTLVAAATLPDARVRVEVVAAWQSTGAARMELPDMLEKVDARAVAWFPSGPAAALSSVFRNRDNVTELKGQSVTEACMGFADLVAGRRIVHNGDPLLGAHVAGAQKYPVGDGWRYIRRGVGHVDAVYAAAGAVQVALTVPTEQPLPRPMVV